MKDKKGKTVLDGFIEIRNQSKSKWWVDQGKEFYNSLKQKWIDDNDILVYSTYNEGTSVVAERFMRTLKGKIYKKWQLMIKKFISVIWINY